MEIETTRYKFLSTPEKGEVSALLLKPSNATFLLVLGHGAGAGMEHANMENIAQNMAQNGIATLRYQFPYMERGGGRDAVKVSLATVESAVKFAERLELGLPLLAGGHSFGGRMTSLASAAGMLPSVKGLIFCSFPLHAPGKPGIDRAAHLPEIPVPVLFLSGTRDTLLTLDLFTPLLENIKDKVTLHLLETANHGYKILKRTRVSKEDVFVEMGRVAGEWLNQTFNA